MRAPDVNGFGVIIAVLSVAGLLAVYSNRVSERIRIPAPALFLVAAAAASDLVPALGQVPILTVQRVVTVMLILLLLDGGMHIGWPCCIRCRRCSAPARSTAWPRSRTGRDSWQCSPPGSWSGTRGTVQGGDRTVPLLTGQPRRDRRVRDDRTNRVPTRPDPGETAG